MDIQGLMGANFRLFEMNTRGTFFIDTMGRPFYDYEYGGFIQLRRHFGHERIEVVAAGRYDQRYTMGRGRFTPRVFMTYALDASRQHILRVGYHVGFRNPSNVALFSWLPTTMQVVGAFPQIDQQLGIAGTNNYTSTSVQAYFEALARRVPRDQAANLLRSVPMGRLRPEVVQSLEAGLRHRFLKDRLFLDISYAYSRCKDLHWFVYVHGPMNPSQTLTPDEVWRENFSAPYQCFYNIPGRPQAQFFTLGWQFQLHRNLRLIGSYSYAQAWGLEAGRETDEGLVAALNTPPHQTNLGLVGENLAERWSFQLWHQWVHAYEFVVLPYEGIMPTYNLLHAQVSYRLPKRHMQFRVGAQNLLNSYHIEVRGGPRIGGTYYLQVMYDFSQL